MSLFKKIYAKKAIAVLLAIFMIFPILPSFGVLGATTGDTITIFTDDDQLVTKMRHNGNPVGTTGAWYIENGEKYPAYCVEPTKPGVGERGGSYDVTIEENTITDPKIYGILLAGYPYKTFSELGMPNAWEAAFATKFALKIYLEDKMGVRNIDGWSPVNTDNQYMYDAIMQIYNEGIKNTALPPVPSVTVIADGGDDMIEQDIDGVLHLVKEYTVTSNVQIKSYTVSIIGSKPTGTIITASDGTEKTTFAPGEKFMVRVPKDNVTGTGTITLDVKGEVANAAILYGASGNVNTQDYALTGAPFIFKNTNAYANYEYEPPTIIIEDEGEEPGELAIIKLDARATA